MLRGLALDAVVTCRFDQAEDMARKLIAAEVVDRTARVEGDYVLAWLRDRALATLTSFTS